MDIFSNSLFKQITYNLKNQFLLLIDNNFHEILRIMNIHDTCDSDSQNYKFISTVKNHCLSEISKNSKFLKNTVSSI